MEYDPPSKKKPPAQDGLLDLPLGGHERPPRPAADTPKQEPPLGDTQPIKPTPRRPPGEIGGPGTTPRHDYAYRSGSAARRKRKIWPWLLLLFVLAAGLAYWFFLRPPVARAGTEALEFGPTRVGRPGEAAEVEIFNRGRLPLQVSGVSIAGEAGDDFAVSEDGCTGASLRRDEGCAITVAFEPTASGDRSGALEVQSNAAVTPLSVPLAGSGLAPSLASVQSSLDFGRIAVGKASEAEALVFGNRGTAPLAIARLAVEGSGESSFVWVANGCSGKTLEPGADCAVRLAFKPGSTGGFKAEARVWSDAPEDPRVVLSGIGVAPGLLILPSQLDFGELRPGQRSGSREVDFENTGNAALAIDRVELRGSSASSFALTSNDCDGTTLEAEGKCRVAVRYQPTDPARHTAALRVRASGLRQRREVPLAGVALAPRLVLSAAVLDFGQVIEYATNENALELRNTGSAPLDLSAVNVSGGGGAFGISARGCPPQLAAGAACTLSLRFSPSRVGAIDARLQVVHNAPGSPVEVRLLGTGVAPPKGDIAVEPRAMDFGSLPIGERSDIRTIKVKSVGNARLEVGGYDLVGSGSADFHIVPASCEGLNSLLPGSDCTIGVRFRPTGSGRSNARIVVRHAGGTVEVDLSGEGF